jgi:hypothetical protein
MGAAGRSEGTRAKPFFSMQSYPWDRLIRLWGPKGLELAESAILSCFEPCPLSGCYDDELRRARRALRANLNGELVRLKQYVNRNAFLIACGDYTDAESDEHLIIGYGRRHGSTTRVSSFHHIRGNADSVHLPTFVAHTMWAYFGADPSHEVLVFHNHPYNPLNLLLDNGPLASRTDRDTMQKRSLNLEQALRALRGEGRVLFYLGENRAVKRFCIPSVLSNLGDAHEHG